MGRSLRDLWSLVFQGVRQHPQVLVPEVLSGLSQGRPEDRPVWREAVPTPCGLTGPTAPEAHARNTNAMQRERLEAQVANCLRRLRFRCQGRQGAPQAHARSREPSPIQVELSQARCG